MKHFKHGMRAQAPDPPQVRPGGDPRLRPLLEAELDRIGPEVLVLLGATAAHALLGRSFEVTQQRGTSSSRPSLRS